MATKIKILGINGSHRKDQNTENMLNDALDSAKMLGPWVETEAVRLLDYNIKYCIACYACYTQLHERGDVFYCTIKDDCHEVLRKMLDADGILVASPVYWGGMSGRLKTFFDRTLGFCHGSSTKVRGALGKKAGGALAIGWDAHGGMEYVIDDIHHWMLTHDMIIVGAGHHHPHGCFVGGAVYKQPVSTPTGYRRDTWGMRSVRGVGKRVAEVALILKEGIDAARKLAESGDIEMAKRKKDGKIEIDWDKFFKVQRHFPTIHIGVPGRIASAERTLDKYVEWMTVRKDEKVGEVFGKDVKKGIDEKEFRKSMLEDHKLILLTDEEMYNHDPEFFEEYLKR